jgi:hypothetical protein
MFAKSRYFILFAAVSILCVLTGCAGTAGNDKERPATAKTADTAPEGRPGFVDVHNHFLGRYGGRGGTEELDYEGAAREALVAMDKFGIKKMFIMPPPFTPNQPGRFTFEDLVPAIRKYPNRFAFLGGGGTLNVMIQQAVTQKGESETLKGRFEKTALEILSKGAIGFGELTAEHLSFDLDHPYESAPPDHPLFLLLSDIAAHHHVPIDLHMEAVPEDMPLPRGKKFESPYNPKVLQANIAGLEKLLAHNRSTKIVWDHAGWCNTGRRTPALCAELLGMYANLYMSFKIRPDSLPERQPMGDLGIKPDWLALIKAYPDRFLIGSDQFYTTPLGPGRRGPSQKDRLGTVKLLALLPPELSRKIGEENVLQVFGQNR